MMDEYLDTAVVLEAKLAEFAAPLAIELGKPFSQRDPIILKEFCKRISTYKAKLQNTLRALRKLKKPSGAIRRNMPRCQYTREVDIYRKGTAILKRIALTEQIRLMVENHVDPPQSPLWHMPARNAFDPILSMIHTAFHKISNPHNQASSAADLGCFADIAFPVQEFEMLMAGAYRISHVREPSIKAPKFLDVGCGGGTKVFFATRYFPNADGLEYDGGYVEAARKTLPLIGASAREIFHADALTFDGYDKYDVIYFYRPLNDDALLAQME